MWARRSASGQCAPAQRSRRSRQFGAISSAALGEFCAGHVQRDRPGSVGSSAPWCRPAQRAVGIVEEFVEHGLDRRLGLVRTGVAHVVMLEAGVDHRDAGLLALLVIGNDAGIGLETGILGAERQDLELAVGHERHAQIVQRHDLLDLVGILLGEIHRDVAAHRMSDHGQLVVVGVRLDLLHLVDGEMDVGDAALNLRQAADIELADLGHHRRIGRQIVLRADRPDSRARRRRSPGTNIR